MSKTLSGSICKLPLALTLHIKPFRCVTSTDDESSDQFAVFELSCAMALRSSAQPMRYCGGFLSVRYMLSADLL